MSFQLFSSGEKLLKVAGQGQKMSKIDYFERGFRWFQPFFIDFQLFYFLTRIIPFKIKLNLFSKSQEMFGQLDFKLYVLFMIKYASCVVQVNK
jgi:hypothetical protein